MWSGCPLNWHCSSAVCPLPALTRTTDVSADAVGSTVSTESAKMVLKLPYLVRLPQKTSMFVLVRIPNLIRVHYHVRASSLLTLNLQEKILSHYVPVHSLHDAHVPTSVTAINLGIAKRHSQYVHTLRTPWPKHVKLYWALNVVQLFTAA